jgi:hypothetical protein
LRSLAEYPDIAGDGDDGAGWKTAEERLLSRRKRYHSAMALLGARACPISRDRGKLAGAGADKCLAILSFTSGAFKCDDSIVGDIALVGLVELCDDERAVFAGRINGIDLKAFARSSHLFT